ncbi:nf-kappa-b-repressing factor-related [Anaeramoeba ignava]|uniref:Nf-kappa-b-repressing factor-related n=1 Tax=Anaeramoeba ignava TaxID=1746090 RepID=A0A9Q0RDK0_ANAIG|nr:nf-kappa-b-repressing factor-related [Anaeramoeba ignava]
MTTEEDELINKLREKITKVAQKLGQVYIQQTQSFLETLDLLPRLCFRFRKIPNNSYIFQEEILSVITSFLVFLQKISYSQFLIFLKDFHTFFKESVNFWDSVVSNEQQKPQFTQFIILIKEQNLDFLINDESFTLNSFSYFGSSLSQKIKLPVRSLFDIQLIQIVITKLLIKLIKSSFYVFQENFDFVTFLVSQIKHSTLKLKIISLECLNHFIRGKASSINHRQLASTLFTFLSQGKTDQERHLLNQLRTPEFEIHLGNCLLSLFETKNASRWSVYACFQNFESLFTWNILNSVTNHLKIVFTKILKEIVSNFPQTTFLVKALFPVLHLEIIQNEIAEIFHICISRLVDSEIFQISLNNNNNNNENKNSGLFKSLQNEKNQKANKQKQNIENHIHFMDKENLKISNILNQFLSAIQKILNLIHNQNETIQIPSSQFGCLISTTKIILQILIGNQDKLRSLIISKVQKLDDLFSRILKEIVPQIVKLAKTQEMQILFEEQNVEKILDLLEVVQQTNLENSRGFLLEMADWIDEKMIEKNQQIVRKCVMLVKEIVLDKREDVEIISKFILDNLVDEGNEEQTRVECLRAIPKVIGNIANQIENYNFMDNFVSPFRDILEKEKSQMILEELAKLIEIMVRKTNGQWNGRIFEKKNENGVSIRPFSLFPNKMRIQYATNIRSSLQKIVPDFTKKMSIEEQETSLLRRCRIFSRFFMDRDDPRFTTKTQVYSLRAFLCLLSNSESKELEEEKQFVEDLFGLLFGENEFLRMEIAKSLYIFVKSQVLTNLDIPEPQNISVQKRIPQTIYDTKIQKLLDHLIEEKLVNSDEPIQEAILVALGSLGSFVEKEFLKQIMIVLVDRLTKPHPISQQFLSFDQIRIISKRMGITESQLFILFKYDLCPLVMRKLKTSDSLVNEIASAIFDGTSQEFIEKYHQYSLPEILIKQGC